MSDEPRAPGNEHDETRTLHVAPGAAAAPDLGGMPAEAEQALRDPRESNLRPRLDLLNTLVDMERARAQRMPSPAREAALRRWTAARAAEAPELEQAIAEGRAPRAVSAK